MTTEIDRPSATDTMIAQFREALREMRCVGSQRLLRRGVSMGHFHLMALLARHGELGMTRIAEILDVSLSNATGLIDRMAERGLVERVRVPDDRRAVRVNLTDNGRAALADLEVFQDDVLARVLGRLEDVQLERLVAAVEDLRAAVLTVAAEDPDRFAHNHDLHAVPPPAAVR